MSFNPLDTAKKFINESVNSISTSYDKVSSDIVGTISPIVQSIKPNINLSEKSTQPIQPIQPTQPIQQTQDSTNLLTPHEKQYESLYVGCFMDDPSNPSMSEFLGNVSNISDCINLGKKNNYECVGIRGGNECYASNIIPSNKSTQSVDRSKYCNVGCDEIGTGNCGGFFYNQVYKTSNLSSESESESENKKEIKQENFQENEQIKAKTVQFLENFISSDDDLKKISMGLDNHNFNCFQPLNIYIIFFWLIILLFLIYLLFEYMHQKINEKII